MQIVQNVQIFGPQNVIKIEIEVSLVTKYREMVMPILYSSSQNMGTTCHRAIRNPLSCFSDEVRHYVVLFQ